MTVTPMTPSEVLPGLRNDGRSLHHRGELEKAIAQAETHLGEIKCLASQLEDADVAVESPS